MNNGINWMGNRVVGSRQSYQSPRTYMNENASATLPVQNDDVSPTQQTEPLPLTLQGPPPISEVGYIPYYLTTNIGKNIRAEFIIGNSQYVDKVGKLIEVGINYFVLEDVNSRTHIMCDLYSVKFVTILQEQHNI